LGKVRIFLLQLRIFPKIMAGVVSPRPSPIANHVLKEIVIMFYRLVSQVFYKLVDYVIVRLESLRVGGQGPDFCIFMYAEQLIQGPEFL
jgi:hypothetical protein